MQAEGCKSGEDQRRRRGGALCVPPLFWKQTGKHHMQSREMEPECALKPVKIAVSLW